MGVKNTLPRSLIAVAASTALILGSVPAVQAQDLSSRDSVVVEDSLEQLPDEARLGSSGVEKLSEASSEGDTDGAREGSSQIGLDLLIGIVGVTILGTVIQLIASAVR